MHEKRQKFIHQFHNLPGLTVKQKQHNLFKLFRENSSFQQEQLDFIAANLNPANHLEKIFFVDFLIYFKRFNELYKKFKNGDEIIVSKVAKQDWFYQTAFKEIDGESFVTVMLPTLSHSLKLRVLKKLPVNEKKADEVFDVLKKRYGVFLATVLLPKCSSKKIREMLLSQPIKFTSAQLKLIYKKDSDLIYIYMEERTKHCGDSLFLNKDPFLVYIAQKNPQMFTKLFNKYQFTTKLGRRTTKNYIKSEKYSIASDPKFYFYMMNKAVTVRKLSKVVQSIFFEIGERRYSCWRLYLSYYPKKHQYAIFQSVYNSFHSCKLGEKPYEISDYILDIIPDPVERERIAKLQLDRNKTNYRLYKYTNPQFCFEELIYPLNNITNNNAFWFLDITFQCCVRNEDTSALLKLLKMIRDRFKKDKTTIDGTILSPLYKSFIIDKFTEEHWKLTMEILSIIINKNHWMMYELYFRSKNLQFLIQKNHDIIDMISKGKSWTRAVCVCIIQENPNVIKSILEKLIEIEVSSPDSVNQDLEGCYSCELAHMCKIFNKHNPQDIIPIYNNPKIMKLITRYIENLKDASKNYNFNSVMKYLICRSSSSEELLQLKKTYFKVYKNLGNLTIAMWFLKHEPEILEDCFEDVLKTSFSTALWRFLKKYSYLGLDRRAIDFCKQRLQDKSDENGRNFAEPFSIIADPDSYLDFVKCYIPTSTKEELPIKELKALYSVRIQLVRHMHLIKSPEKVLPLTLEFCKSDYLHHALTPMYSCIYKLPETDVKVFIEKLLQASSLSVKKHGVNITCIVCDIESIYECFKKTTDFSFMSAVRYFVKNPSDKFWELIEIIVCNLDKKNVRVLEEAVDVTIPRKYRSKYVEMVWLTLDRLESPELKVTLQVRTDNETIQNFDPQNAFEIVRGNIFKFDTVYDFISRIFIFVDSDEKYPFFVSILRKFKENRSQQDVRQKLHKFTKSLFENYVKSNQSNNKFVTEIQAAYKSVFSTIEALEEHIIVSCLPFRNIEALSKRLVEMNNAFDEEYRTMAGKILADTINYIFPRIFPWEGSIYRLCSSLLKMRKSVHDSVFILAVLRKNRPFHENALYDEIMKELGEVEDEIVQLLYNFFLRQT